jgi:dUTP pyrophosphatase
VVSEDPLRITLPIQRVDPPLQVPLHSPLPLPAYAHEGDAGLDLRSAEDVTIPPLGRVLVGTGFALAIPPGFAGFVQPRSGLALKQGLSLANSPGLIDSHYRGEIKIILINLDPTTPIDIHRGDKIAQLVVQPVAECALVESTSLDATGRGEAGFGSTGI